MRTNEINERSFTACSAFNENIRCYALIGEQKFFNQIKHRDEE